MAGFPDIWMAELLSRNEIVSVVSEYTALKAKGRRMWGICPFHNEKTPSFTVSPDKQLYYCFGCHAGGSVLQFIMEIEKLSYVDAVKHLARRVQMELPDEIDDTALQKERAFKDRLYAACHEAAVYYYKLLLAAEGEKARKYLAQRGLNMATVKRFALGWAPQAPGMLTKHLMDQGFTLNELVAAGLSRQGGGKNYDMFRTRVMFPIFASDGRVIGFGGRVLDNSQPKYLNTVETPIFNKRMNLYGINLLKGKKLDDLVIVEGYMDVISLNSHGVENAVASLGTALTMQQTRLAKRYAPTVYIAYDGDSAGQNATLRGLDILSSEGLAVKVVQFPKDMDPDDFIRKRGASGFEELKQKALSLNAFILKTIREKHDINTEDGMEAYAVEACAFIAKLSPVEQERYYSTLSLQTGFPVEILKAQSLSGTKKQEKNRFTNYRNNRDKKIAEISAQRLALEQTLLGLMALYTDLAMEVAAQGLPFKLTAHVNFAKTLLEQIKKENDNTLALVLSKLEPEQAEQCAVALSQPDYDEKTAAEMVMECMRGLKKQDIIERLHNLDTEIKGEISQERRNELAGLSHSLNLELEKLKKINS